MLKDPGSVWINLSQYSGDWRNPTSLHGFGPKIQLYLKSVMQEILEYLIETQVWVLKSQPVL